MINKEMTIDLNDMCRRLLKRWKFILAWVVICGMLFGAFGAFKNYRGYQAALDAQQNVSREDQLSALRKALNLSDWQVSDVERTAEMYLALQEEYEDTLSYIAHSPTMQMDANSVSYMTIQYGITIEDVVYPVIEARDYRDAILGTLSAQVTTDENKQSFAQILSPSTDVAYVNELVSTWVDTGKHCFGFTLYGETESACEEVAKLIDAAVEREVKALRDVYGEFQLVQLVCNYYENVASKDVLNAQQNQLTLLNTLRNSMVTAGNSLSADQKEYYTALLQIEGAEEMQETPAAEQDEDAGFSYIHKKFIALGLVLGLAIPCGWICLGYVLSKKLRVPSDMKEGFGVSVIAALKSGECGEDSDAVQMIASRIYLECQKNGYKEVYLAGGTGDPAIAALVTSVEKAVAVKGISLRSGDIVAVPDALENLIKLDAMVLVERVDVSTYHNIDQECDICRQNGIQVLGAVVIC